MRNEKKHKLAGTSNPSAGRQRRRERGMQLVEMAFVLPIMCLLLAAVVEFSWYFYSYATMARATRAAAGYIYTKPFDTTGITTAKNMVVCGEVSSSSSACNGKTPMVTGLTTSNVDVALAGTYPNQTVTVKVINYSYSPVNLFKMDKLANTKWDTTVTKVNAATTMRYVGNR